LNEDWQKYVDQKKVNLYIFRSWFLGVLMQFLVDDVLVKYSQRWQLHLYSGASTQAKK